MSSFATPVLAQAEATTAGGPVAWIIAGVVIIGFTVAVLVNMRRGRAEVGSEVELAANRKPYLSDEELETKKLDRTLTLGLLFLAVIGVTLPLYWLAEPGRQADAVVGFSERAVSQGETIYNETAKCAECHGPTGGGGAKETPLLNEEGQFVANVSWQSPSLDTVLYRYSKEEVMFILEYGRPNSPMPAWGAKGGGPLTEQQLEHTVAFLESIQLPASQVRADVDKEIEDSCKPDGDGKCTVEGGKFATLGEAIFDMGYYSKFYGGAFSCGRCHTKGWSYDDAGTPGGGYFGWNLTGGSTISQFPSAAGHEAFISKGSELGKPYGRGGMGSGQMPGFGLNPNAEIPGSTMSPDQVMLTPEQIAAVVEYERGL
jgi:mono/diheme cytochrome c family protein